MTGIFEKILGNRSFFYIVICFLFVGCFTPLCYGSEKGDVQWGFSVLLGPHAGGHMDFTQSALLPRVGLALREKWDLEFEGNLSRYFIDEAKNLYLIGVNGNLLFEPVQWGKGIPFLLVGEG